MLFYGKIDIVDERASVLLLLVPGHDNKVAEVYHHKAEDKRERSVEECLGEVAVGKAGVAFVRKGGEGGEAAAKSDGEE